MLEAWQAPGQQRLMPICAASPRAAISTCYPSSWNNSALRWETLLTVSTVVSFHGNMVYLYEDKSSLLTWVSSPQAWQSRRLEGQSTLGPGPWVSSSGTWGVADED